MATSALGAAGWYIVFSGDIFLEESPNGGGYHTQMKLAAHRPSVDNSWPKMVGLGESVAGWERQRFAEMRKAIRCGEWPFVLTKAENPFSVFS
jgi:hypothetical protein